MFYSSSLDKTNKEHCNILYYYKIITEYVPVIPQYDEPDYEGCPTKMISAPDFEKEEIPHDPNQCMECAIPILKSHRMGTSLSIDSIDDSIIRSRSHTTDSISSSTCSTPTQSISHSRSGTELQTMAPATFSKSPKSPLLTAKFKVGSIKSDDGVENGTVSTEESKSELQRNDGEKIEMNGRGGRSPSSSPLIRMKRIYHSNSDDQQKRQISSEIEREEVDRENESAEQRRDLSDGYSPSDRSEKVRREEEEEKEIVEVEERDGVEGGESKKESTRQQLSPGQATSLNDDSLANSSSSNEIVATERLEVKKGGSDVTSSSSSSMSTREGGASTEGDEASSSTQSSETKDVTAEVLINVVPSR